MINGLHHISLIASSEESVDFYKELGFEEEKRIKRPYDTVVLLTGHGIGLEIFIDTRHPVRSTPEPLGWRNVSLQVDDIDHISSEKGLAIKTDWNGERYVEIRDPDGNVIQLHE